MVATCFANCHSIFQISSPVSSWLFRSPCATPCCCSCLSISLQWLINSSFFTFLRQSAGIEWTFHKNRQERWPFLHWNMSIHFYFIWEQYYLGRLFLASSFICHLPHTLIFSWDTYVIWKFLMLWDMPLLENSNTFKLLLIC